MEKILVIAKPDLVIRRGAGARMLKEFLGFAVGKILSSNELVIPTRIAEAHYAHLNKRPFYRWLLSYISCFRSFVFVLQTERPIANIREKLGSTIVQTASPTSLRYIYGLYDGMNGLHVSESEEAARKEVDNWLSFGVLQIDKIAFDVPSYIERYQNAQDNTQQIHKLLAVQKERDLLFSTSPKYAHQLFGLILEEAIDVDEESVRHLYDLVLESIPLY